MLKIDPEERASAGELLNSSWLYEDNNEIYQKENCQAPQQVVEEQSPLNLINFDPQVPTLDQSSDNLISSYSDQYGEQLKTLDKSFK